jgi:glycosyltransferase involved in cell wall biosynthesis
MILFDLTHTSHSVASTGIQRQARCTFSALAAQTATIPVCFDPYANCWRPLDPDESRTVDVPTTGNRRGSRWTTAQRIRGWSRRLFRNPPPVPVAQGIVCAEIFSPLVARNLPALFEKCQGPKVAFFFDAFPLTHPELTPKSTVARFPAFMQELLRFDGVAANSRATADSLLGYWRWLGVTNPPAVTVLPLAADVPHPPTPKPPGGDLPPEILCVGTIEGRKNHLALLEAAEGLWQEGLHFSLHLVGLPRKDTAGQALAAIARLKAAGRPIRYEGPLAESALESAWANCAFSVYPSELEGFGLPILESLAHGRACVCSSRGAPGEIATGGGCIGLNPADSLNIREAMRRLLTDRQALEQLALEAGQRRIPTWPECAAHLHSWMQSLPLTPQRPSLM